jgi:hypothetical protein
MLKISDRMLEFSDHTLEFSDRTLEFSDYTLKTIANIIKLKELKLLINKNITRIEY